ncbi:M48 family metallopeptidase [uncultured Clostridium sp.]|uniref:M48 family metallopeptidase n=1 Tax=uncultured Clostridium sp. TaxID=59620 RepID=UPI0025E94AA1|nr:SprT family zinc-dependent metalloprotease [uncultured Clostridium sp.]
MNTYEVAYGDEKIKFIVERKKVKNVNLNIRVNGDVVVTVNDEVPFNYIEGFILKKARWIIKQVKYFKAHEVIEKEEKELVSGENIKYLGKQYRLKVVEAEDDYVKYLRGYIYLYVKDKSNYKKKEELLNEWFDTKCRYIFNSLYNEIYSIVSKYDVPEVKIDVRKMKARWGSCMPHKNTIILNRDLIKAPKHCIKYVILHELVHMIYKEHNNEFYNFLYTLMPDWKERKKILDEEVIMTL